MKIQTFDEFDEFAHSVRGIDSRMLFRNAAKKSWSISSLTLGGLQIQLGELGSGNIAAGQMRDDVLMVYLPLTQSVQYKGNGVDIDSGRLLVLEPSAEFCVSTSQPHDWCAVSLPLQECSEPFRDNLRRRCRVTAPDESLSRRLRDLVENVLAAAHRHDEFEQSAAAGAVASELKDLVTQIAVPPPLKLGSMAGRPRLDRAELIRDTFRILDKDRDLDLSVDDLANAVDVSDRTLRSVFKEFFGIGPANYLRLRQLHAVRRALLAADPTQTTVARVLADHEVWAFGRFAANYRKLFGEPPSQTLIRMP